MRIRALIASAVLVGVGAFINAATAHADGRDGDAVHGNNNTSVFASAVATNGGTANVTVNANGQTPSGGGSVTPPVIGTPETGTVQLAGASLGPLIGSETANVTVQYSCPTGSPSDARIEVSVGQANDVFGAAGSPVTCDGNVRSLTQAVPVQTQGLFQTGPAAVQIWLHSPTDPAHLNQMIQTTAML